MRFLLFSILLIFFYSCGTAVNIDYEKEKDFTTIKTYQFFPDLLSGLSELDQNRIINLSDSILQNQGFSRSNHPDVYINFYVNEPVLAPRNTIGVGFGNYGRNSSIGVSGGIPIGARQIEQQLTLDVIDAKKDQLIWQAITQIKMRENASPSQKESTFYNVLSKVFKRFPPK